MSDTLKNCEYCGKEFTAKRSTARFCSGACKLKFNRLTKDEAIPARLGKISVPTVVVVSEKPDPKNISASHKGHWFGKVPHRAVFIGCEAKDCPHMNAPEPGWEVTCTSVCCSIE